MTLRSAAVSLLLLASLLVTTAYGDTLTLRDGSSVTGSWLGMNSEEIRFQVNGEARTFPRPRVAKVTFGPVAAPAKPELGMTIAQVTAILGQPDSTSESGGTQVYVFKNLKVTFVDGKAADIQ